jgi:MATE family multidrug resistance protein
MNFQNLTSLGLDGIAHAAEAMVGKAVGKKDDRALRATVALTLRWSLYFAAAFTAFYVVTGPLIVRTLTDLPDVRATAMVYLPWLVVSPLISVWCFLYDGVYVGMTRAREMRNIMVFSTFGVFLPTWFVTQGFGNHGLWFALMAFLASRGVGMHLGYRKSTRTALRPDVP